MTVHTLPDSSAFAQGVNAYLTAAEAGIPDLRPEARKQVIWAGKPEQQTDWVVVYIHGFSATLHEVRPLPDLVAQVLGANLVFTRLTGHGQDGAAMATATRQAWMADVAEAIAVARRCGRRLLVMGTSTGASLVTLALHAPWGRDVAGAILISPNYRLKQAGGGLLAMPLARWWVPFVLGAERAFEPRSRDHAKYWTSRYPTQALVPMADAMTAARHAPHHTVKTPALFVYDPRDTLVDHAATRAVANAWHARAVITEVQVGAGDDPGYHVIAGDVLSPGMTRPLAKRIIGFAHSLV